jgi:hypothetical protein
MPTRLTWLVAAAILVPTLGCSGGGGSATPVTLATVTGTVTVNGKPADNGEITFDGSSRERPTEGVRTAPIGSDGTYKIEAVVGQNVVAVAGTLVDQFRGLGYETLDFTVKPGVNSFNLDLKWSPPMIETAEDQ